MTTPVPITSTVDMNLLFNGIENSSEERKGWRYRSNQKTIDSSSSTGNAKSNSEAIAGTGYQHPTDQASTSTSTSAVNEVDVKAAQLPVKYLLVMLNMAVKTPAGERVDSLFKIAQSSGSLTLADSDYNNNTSNNSNSNSNISNNNYTVDTMSSSSAAASSPVVPAAVMTMTTDDGTPEARRGDGSDSDSGGGGVSVETCSVAAGAEVVSYLADSWQVRMS
jgi:hypothetical protein